MSHQRTQSKNLAWDARRSEISRAAATLIKEKGFNGSSMENLAKKLRIRKATLYYYFSSKQELLFETLIAAVGGALSRVEQIAKSEINSREKLRLFIIDHIESIVDNLEPVTVFLEEGRFLQRQYREKYVVMRDRYEKLLRGILTEGIGKGEFRKVDPKITGLAILGMCNWTIRWYKPEGSVSARDLAIKYTDIIEKGLLPRAKGK